MAYLFCNTSKHRLGNSLFMVASCIGVARANGMEPLFPANWKHRNNFNLPDEMFGDCSTEATYKEPYFHFCAPDIDPNKNTELHGYFQSEQYFHNISDEIKLYLTPKGVLPGSIDAVSIHHRRGDYVGNPNYQQLGMGYYISAYDTFFNGKEIKTFSDDHQYIDLHYNGNTLKSIPTNEIDDFKSMVSCKYHICSNSTFSWWAAYLSDSDKVIRPFKYFDGPLAARNKEDDLWPAKWRVNNNTEKIDLRDTTFIIPFMGDHKDRYDNILTVVGFIKKHFECSVLIGEINTDLLMDAIKYTMPVFHRTKVLNDLTRKSETPYVFNLDADAVFSPWQIYKSVERLRNGVDIVYPFGGKVANVPRSALQPFFNTLDAGVFAGKVWPWMPSTYQSVGMAFGYNKDSFLKVGGENESFISYGAEDQFRYMWFRRSGLKVERIAGTAFHFEHWRGNNSSERHSDSNNNRQVFEAELKRYREWCQQTEDKDLWRPFQSSTGKMCNW